MNCKNCSRLTEENLLLKKQLHKLKEMLSEDGSNAFLPSLVSDPDNSEADERDYRSLVKKFSKW